MQTTGATALASQGRELIGHGTHQHPDGFGSPVGKLEGTNLAIEDMSPRDLEAYGIVEGKQVTLNFEGGVCVQGRIVTGKRDIRGKIQLITFRECRVTYQDEVLFDPSWGVYDMAVGKSVVSAFAGPADDKSFKNIHKKSEVTAQKISYSDEALRLHELYQKVAALRQSTDALGHKTEQLEQVWSTMKTDHPKDWLLALECYELMYRWDHARSDEAKQYLHELATSEELKTLIENGLRLIN